MLLILYDTLMHNDSFLNDLNEKQREAVTIMNGPLLILAGAGSGKTKTLAYRIAHLIHQGIPASSILAITFTNKAAEEMRNRIFFLLAKKSGNQHDENGKNDEGVTISPIRQMAEVHHIHHFELVSSPFIGTFHSFCNRILREHANRLGYTPHFTIFDEDDSLGLFKEIQKELNIHPKQFPAGMIAHTVSRLKSELIDASAYAETADGEFFPKKISAVYAEYQRRLLSANAMDFDDLIMNAVRLFEAHPEILHEYQNRYRFIHVDEYQDTNIAEYHLIELLAKKHRNIAVVGDDAQSIYAFRHADYRNILNFEKNWPEARTVILDENYRSTQTILDAASDIISKNIRQKQKRLWTRNNGGEPVVVIRADNERDEARFIAEEIERLRETQGFSYNDCAILYRTNAQSRVIEEMFLRYDIPYTIVGGLRFYARKEIKDLIAYLRAALNREDAVSLKRIVNVPPRKIGKRTFLKFLMESPLRENERRALERFRGLLGWLQKEIKETQPSKLIQRLIKKINYEEYLADSSTDAEARVENIREFIGLAKRYDTLEKPAGLIAMLEDVALMSETEHSKKEKNGAFLMTLHSAKGLEFPVVFIAGLEEGIFPHSRSSSDPAALEEERRLCYVGITRAKERCFLLYARRRTLFGSSQANIPSRFLSEISPEFIAKRKYEGDVDDFEEEIIE